MAFYKKSKLHTGTALICSLAIVFSALPVYDRQSAKPDLCP